MPGCNILFNVAGVKGRGAINPLIRKNYQPLLADDLKKKTKWKKKWLGRVHGIISFMHIHARPQTAFTFICAMSITPRLEMKYSFAR